MTKIQVCKECGKEINTRRIYKSMRGYTIRKMNLDGTPHIDVWKDPFANSGIADSI